MNNRVVFAAAGHGKTYSLCSQAKAAIKHGHKYVLLISYTNEGVRSLENEYRKQNCGVLDNRVVFKSWYSVLLSEFIKPYQCNLRLTHKIGKKDTIVVFPENYVKSFAFYDTQQLKQFNQTQLRYFVNRGGDVIPDHASHLAYLCNEHSAGNAISRLEQIYSYIFIDELQDYAGWDLEIIKVLFKSQIQLQCVGDYKQATYRTNNSPKNRQYRDEKIRDFFLELEAQKLCTIFYENSTRRFGQEICEFINSIYDDPNTTLFPNPDAIDGQEFENTGVYLLDIDNLAKYCEHYHPVILRYDKRSKINFEHSCDVFNYGGSKGATYERVVIVPVSTTLPFIEKQQKITSKQTRSKFYVACTRARYSIVFAISNPTENIYFKPCEICINDCTIPAFKYVKA